MRELGDAQKCLKKGSPFSQRSEQARHDEVGGLGVRVRLSCTSPRTPQPQHAAQARSEWQQAMSGGHLTGKETSRLLAAIQPDKISSDYSTTQLTKQLIPLISSQFYSSNFFIHIYKQ